MRAIELCLDRARLDPPPEDVKSLTDSYVDVLERLNRIAQVQELVRLEVSSDTRRILEDRKGFKSKANKLRTLAGVVTPSDVMWTLVSWILDRSVTIEDSRGVEIAVATGAVCGMPDDLDYLTDSQVRDLGQLVAVASRPAPDDTSGTVSDPCIVTCLPPGKTLHCSVRSCVDLMLAGSGVQMQENKDVDCCLVGDPGDAMDILDPTTLWLDARGNDERIRAVEMMTMKVAPKVDQPRLRRWSFGKEFIEIARKYKYLTEKTRANGLLEVMAYTILGEQVMGTPRPLYEDEKCKIVRVRGDDVGRHRDTGRDLRLNYWRCGDGSIEFGAACGQHDNQLLPR